MRFYDNHKNFDIWITNEINNPKTIEIITRNAELGIVLTKRNVKYIENLPYYFAEEKSKIDTFLQNPNDFLAFPAFRQLNKELVAKIKQQPNQPAPEMKR
ncbi:MAG: hypothetical protein PHQ62_00190 [Clostridia bacterium]|nr:hypothetical protein [Clostridia bacterium]